MFVFGCAWAGLGSFPCTTVCVCTVAHGPRRFACVCCTQVNLPISGALHSTIGNPSVTLWTWDLATKGWSIQGGLAGLWGCFVPCVCTYVAISFHLTYLSIHLGGDVTWLHVASNSRRVKEAGAHTVLLSSAERNWPFCVCAATPYYRTVVPHQKNQSMPHVCVLLFGVIVAVCVEQHYLCLHGHWGFQA